MEKDRLFYQIFGIYFLKIESYEHSQTQNITCEINGSPDDEFNYKLDGA